MTPAVIEYPQLLRLYRLAYNTINGFIFCENPGKAGALCHSGLPINQIWKHLTQMAICESSDCVVHGYHIKPSEKEKLHNEIRALYPNAPFTPLDLQNIVPLPDQVGPIVGAPPPIPGYICNLCGRGYRKNGVHSHVRDKHSTVPKQPGTLIDNLFTPVPQMQSLSLHKNFIRFFAIRPGEARDEHAFPIATSKDMHVLNALHEAIFGPEESVTELDVVAVQEFFRNSGAIDHVKGLSPSDLTRLVGLPREDEPKLIKLRRSQILRFEAHSKRVVHGNIALRRLIAITKPYVIWKMSTI